jgi:hypothetical protein
VRREATLLLFTVIAFAKATKVQRIMLAAGMDVIGEQVIVGNQVALVGVIPKPGGVLDQLALVIMYPEN